MIDPSRNRRFQTEAAMSFPYFPIISPYVCACGHLSLLRTVRFATPSLYHKLLLKSSNMRRKQRGGKEKAVLRLLFPLRVIGIFLCRRFRNIPKNIHLRRAHFRNTDTRIPDDVLPICLQSPHHNTKTLFFDGCSQMPQNLFLLLFLL